MGKYGPLAAHLGSRPEDATWTSLSFSDIDALVGGLPASARTHRTWWGNSSHGQALAWREAGWHVDAVSLDSEQVRFARGRVGGSYADARASRTGPVSPTRRSATSEPVPEPPPDLMPPRVDVAVSLTWAWAGPVTLPADKLGFPPVPRAPGVYRMTLHRPASDGPLRAYIGQSGDLRQRMGNYRNPRPRQQTSWRVNGLLRDHLELGGSVSLETALEGTWRCGGVAATLDLSRTTCRLLCESAALLALDTVPGLRLQNKAELIPDTDE